MELRSVRLSIPEGCNLVLGQTHFIKTAEDLYEVIVTAVPHAHFGVAFSEASGPCLIRSEGNDEGLIAACIANLQALSAGHVFCILLRDAYPINILNAVKQCPEACRIFCATANPVEAIVAATEQGDGVLGVVDGFAGRDDRRRLPAAAAGGPRVRRAARGGARAQLVAAPLAALALCRALGIVGTAAAVSVLEAGMPPMISAGRSRCWRGWPRN